MKLISRGTDRMINSEGLCLQSHGFLAETQLNIQSHCRISGRKIIARPSGLGYSFVGDVLPLLSSKWLHQLSDGGLNIFTPHSVIMTDEAF